ncbi:MAG: signal recognition particle-docking protein FtsY [Planctomycetes bacterium]|nr:signal recognition particle-docking protein FtsY [Planctomycetota bacterium]
MGLFATTAGAIRRVLARTREVMGGSLGGPLSGPLSAEVIDEIEGRLMRADVGPGATTAIIDELRASHRAGRFTGAGDTIEFLKQRLKQRLQAVDRSLLMAPDGPTVILMVGVNGSGKTTSLAKMAASFRSRGQSVIIAAADTYRAAAVSQLEIWADRLDVDIVKGAAGGDPAAVVFDAVTAARARGIDVLLIDTAGRLHTQRNLMRQLTKIRGVAAKKIAGAPHEVLLVLDATAGQNAIRQAEQFKAAVDVTGIFLAKLDGTAKGGIVVAIQDVLGIPVKLIGVGETPDDVETFEPDAFIEAMFEP